MISWAFVFALSYAVIVWLLWTVRAMWRGTFPWAWVLLLVLTGGMFAFVPARFHRPFNR